MIDDYDSGSDSSLSDAMLGFHESQIPSAETTDRYASYVGAVERRGRQTWAEELPDPTKARLSHEEVLKLQNVLRRPALNWHAKSYRLNLERAQATKLVFGKEAISAVRAGFLSAYHEYEPEFDIKQLDALDNQFIIDYIERKIRSLFHTVADNFLLRGDLSPLIGTEGGFEPSVSATIRKRIEVPGELDQSFMDSLYWSIWIFVSTGGSIGGDWGAMVAMRKRLYLRIQPEEVIQFNDPDEFDLSFE